MSYYRYIAGLYTSDLPQLNRTLRSSSVPRHVPELHTARYTRSTSVPPTPSFTPCMSPIPPSYTPSMTPTTPYYTPLPTRYAATPFRDRAMSVPPLLTSSFPGGREGYHFSDFDCKVMDYMGKLHREDTAKSYLSKTRTSRSVPTPSVNRNTNILGDSSSCGYNYSDSDKYSSDYLYPVTRDVLGSFKHFNLSHQTLNERNMRSTSPLVARELNRYYGTHRRTDYMGDVSAGGLTDFRYYNYRPVPYLGGSDNFKYMECKPFRKQPRGNINGGRCL